MCLIEKFYNSPWIWIELVSIIIFSILHIVFGSIRKGPDFNTYDLFNISPFFNFYLGYPCFTNNVFHTWGGWKRKEKDSKDSDTYSWHYYDKTDITIINGYCFCYKYISYKDLLYNGQIIKNGTECPKKYYKNCGRIDTLNQELCIEKNEECPLYDVGIGKPPDLFNYTYNNVSDIYYNNDNYNISNKTIIGKLILNDGQPCYDSNEKLWRQFSSSETNETHLECTNIQYGNNGENRFIKKGEITYKKLYEDNLREELLNKLFKGRIKNESVSLYKREFYGIDKIYDEKFNLTDDLKNLNKIQKIDKIIQISEGSVMVALSFIALINELQSYSNKKKRYFTQKSYCFIYLLYIVAVGGALSYHTISYISILNYNSINYNCSDSITNEIIKQGNEYNKKVMIKNMLSFYIDSVAIAGNLIGFLIGSILHIIEQRSKDNNNKPNEYQSVDNINSEGSEAPYYANYPSSI